MPGVAAKCTDRWMRAVQVLTALLVSYFDEQGMQARWVASKRWGLNGVNSKREKIELRAYA